MKNKDEGIELALTEVISQYKRIYDSSDLLDQKATSFIGFISIFFGIVIGIMMSGNVISTFNSDNIWIFFIMLLVLLLISLFFSFKIIFGSTVLMGPDLVKLYKERRKQKHDLAEWIMEAYIHIVYMNYKRLLKRLFMWKLSVYFALLSILGMALLLIEILFQQIIVYFIGISLIIALSVLGPYFLYNKDTNTHLEELVENWKKTKEEMHEKEEKRKEEGRERRN